MAHEPDYRGRLLRLAEFLEQLPPERFGFGSWVGSDWKGKPDLSCGTTACALGWATVALPECGLELRRRQKGDYAWVVLSSLPRDVETSYHYTAEATRDALGLSADETELLFTPLDYDGDDEDSDALDYTDERLPEDATAQEVAAHIRSFVAKKYPGATP